MQSGTFAKHVAPGLYQIKETGGLVTASVDRLLADGSMLSAPENEHLMATIDAIILAEYPAAPTSVGQSGASVTQLVTAFAILVQWMKVRGVHYFSHLTELDLHSFIYDSSCGLDAVLKSQERLGAVLNKLGLDASAPTLNVRTAFTEAFISGTQRPFLPAARDLFDNYAKTLTVSAYRPLPPKQVTTGVLFARARIFQLLWDYRDRVEDGLSFEPSQQEIAQRVARWGKPITGTRTLPIDYTCNLVGMAFTWLYEYGPPLAEVLRELANQPLSEREKTAFLKQTLDGFNAAAARKGWTIRLQRNKEQPKQDHFTWFSATSVLLPIACFVICGIFTARRMSELVSLHYDHLQGDVQTGYWFTSYVGKRATYDPFPCTVSVADSFRTLTYLMALRGVAKEEPLFSAIRGTGRLSQRLRNALATFGTLVKSTDGEKWRLAPHQFRKIFALIYRWRYDHPSLIALSLHFGHVNHKQIRPYINSNEWKRDNLEAGKQFTLEKLKDIALGKVEPRGIFGKSIQRAITRAIAQVELADESEQLTVLNQLLERRQLDLRATMWGYCGATSAHSNLRRAACGTADDVRSKATVDPEKSSEDICAGCLFFCTDVSRQPHWLGKSERLRLAIVGAPDGSMAKQKMQDRHQKIERFARNNFKERDANKGTF